MNDEHDILCRDIRCRGPLDNGIPLTILGDVYVIAPLSRERLLPLLDRILALHDKSWDDLDRTDYSLMVELVGASLAQNHRRMKVATLEYVANEPPVFRQVWNCVLQLLTASIVAGTLGSLN